MATERTPSLIDAQVEAARERGDFDHLPGRGKPLELEDMHGLTPEQRTEALVLRSCGELMPEVVLIREIRAAREQLARVHAAPDRERLEAALASKLLELREALKARRSTSVR